MIKAVCFDLWGTLAYDVNGVKPSSAIRSLLRDKGLLEIEDATYDRTYEEALMRSELISANEQYYALLKALNISCFNPDVKELTGKIKQILVGTKSRLYGDAILVLKLLKENYNLALVTNASVRSEGLISRIAEYFKVVAPSYRTGLLKPDKEAFLNVLEQLVVKPSNAVMVGDSIESDINGAKNVGMHAILIDRNNKYDYTTAIRNLQGLEEALKSFE